MSQVLEVGHSKTCNIFPSSVCHNDHHQLCSSLAVISWFIYRLRRKSVLSDSVHDIWQKDTHVLSHVNWGCCLGYNGFWTNFLWLFKSTLKIIHVKGKVNGLLHAHNARVSTLNSLLEDYAQQSKGPGMHSCHTLYTMFYEQVLT